MSLAEPTSRPFEPGTTGWTAADLDDLRIEAQWEFGHYEIVEGVLTTMPPAYYDHGASIASLIRILGNHLHDNGIKGRVVTEPDIIVSETRVAKPDIAVVTAADLEAQKAAAVNAGRRDPKKTRLLVPPTLVIESLSPDHERHDTQIKRRWYSEFRIAHYWLMDAYRRTFQCLVLQEADYVLETEGRENAQVRPSLFPGLVIPLQELWGMQD
jgi:Uma2 family endonuclease